MTNKVGNQEEPGITFSQKFRHAVEKALSLGNSRVSHLGHDSNQLSHKSWILKKLFPWISWIMDFLVARKDE